MRNRASHNIHMDAHTHSGYTVLPELKYRVFTMIISVRVKIY